MSAVLTGITNVVRANIAGAAQQAVKTATGNIKSIAGLNPTGSNSQLGQMSNLMGGTSSDILSYPLNVDTDEQQGHYVLFHINTRTNGKLLTPKSGKSIKAATDKARAEINQEPEDIGAAGNPDLSFDGGGTKIPKVDAVKKGGTRSIVLSKLPTKKLEKSIALYMPAQVTATYGVNYSDKEIGSLAMAGSAAIEAFKAGGSNTEAKIRSALSAAGPAGKEMLQGFLEGALDAVAPGAQALAQLERGTVVTPRMEMMFEGVGRRSFSYTFNFIPKSEQEALVVEEIIQHFKFYMMPAYSNPNTRREMDIPGTFDIQYMYRGSENNFINKVSTCFLTQVDVQYGDAKFKTYEEATGLRGKGLPPQKSQIQLSFSEIELLSQDKIADGF